MSGDPAPGPLVLVVEDEAPMRRFLRVTLEAHGYRLVETGSGAEALRLAAQHVPDAVVLDLGLPDIDGREVLRRLREWLAAPVVIVSARTQEAEKIAALDEGADDYLTKPFGVGELLARLRVALRHAAGRGAAADGATFTAGPLHADLVARRITVDGREVHLTPVEYKLLVTLIQNADKVVTHRQLLQAVWGPNAVEHTHYLRVYMAHLRRKLEPVPGRTRIFTTEAGVGYRLRSEPLDD